MPRGPRVELAGAIHHVTARSPSPRLLFRHDVDHRTYVDLLEREVGARTWSLYSWCLMPNHVHLLLRTDEADLGAGVKRMHERYATYVNRRYAEHGHVFGGRFHNRLITSDRHFVAALRYIARNPVAAGLCQSATRWRWSAHRALAGHQDVPAALSADAALAWLDPRPSEARRAYRALVAETDAKLMRRLERDAETDMWLVDAVDHHGVTVDELSAQLGLRRTATYRRLAAVRKQLADEGASPSRPPRTGGTGP